MIWNKNQIYMQDKAIFYFIDSVIFKTYLISYILCYAIFAVPLN